MYFDLIVYTGVVFLINIITYLVGKGLNIVDNPNIKRKIHKTNIICVGGMSIFVSYMIMIYKLNLPVNNQDFINFLYNIETISLNQIILFLVVLLSIVLKYVSQIVKHDD